MADACHGPSSALDFAMTEVQKQQAESLASMEALRKQHLDWAKAVQSMLQQMSDCGEAETPMATRSPGLHRQVSSASSHRGARFSVSGAGAWELQKLRNSVAEREPPKPEVRFPQETISEDEEVDSTERALPTSPSSTKMTNQSGTPVALFRTRSSQHSKILEEVLSKGARPSGRTLTKWERRQQMLAQIVESNCFECFTGLIILFNLVLIGVEAEMTVKDMDTDWARHLEQGFLVVYTLELVLRFAVGGWPLFKSGWFLLDFSLVCIGILALLLIPIMESSDSQSFEKVLIVRGLRLLRLARVLRMVHRFKVVWRLVSGLLSAWDTMASTTGLIMIWLYVFGCVALEFITLDPDLLQDPQTAAIVKSNFGSLLQATMTLLQFVTMDAIANVYYPLILAKPQLIIYFLPLLMFLSIGLMNLVTAVLVEHALEHASQEAEHARINQKQQIKATLPDLLEVFNGLDADGSGALTRQELADVPVSVLPPNVLQNVSVDSMEELFEMLDLDGGGTLTQDEFLEGLLSILLLDVPIWAVQMQKQLIQLSKHVTPFRERSMSDCDVRSKNDIVAVDHKAGVPPERRDEDDYIANIASIKERQLSREPIPPLGGALFPECGDAAG